MIAYFPSPYPDELFISVLMRYHVHSGNFSDAHTAREVYGSRKIEPNVELFGGLSEILVSVMKKIMPLGGWLERHTMFPAYARFLPRERLNVAADAAINMDLTTLQYKLSPPRSGANEYFRYCPRCVAEDRSRYGETYWRRSHQLRGIRVCAAHNCRLTVSDIPFRKVKGVVDAAAETVIPLEEAVSVEYVTSSAEQDYSRYVVKVFNEPLQWNNEVSIDEFLSSRIREKYPLASRGMYIDRAAFEEDINKLLEAVGMQMGSMDKVLRRHTINKNFMLSQTCLIAMLLEITAEELVRPPLSPEEKQKSTGQHSLHGKRKLTSPARKGVDWAAEDEKLLPKVKEVIASMQGDTDHEPVRVSVNSVCKALRIPYARMRNLPRCREYIEKKIPSVEDYRAKRLVWAVRQIDASGKPLSKQRIYERVNMNHNVIASAVPFLPEYADEDICRRVRELL